MNPPLSPVQRRDLKARAHGLNPVVMIGDDGLSTGVLAEIERAIKIHELIKIRVFGADRDQRDLLLAEICSQTGSRPVQHIGRILVIYREKPEPVARASKPRTEKPRAAKPRARADARRTSGFNSRPDSGTARAPRGAGARPPRSQQGTPARSRRATGPSRKTSGRTSRIR